jgi:hypothetical protein
MTSPLDRAKQLVALATNGSAEREEARTAALQACRLIAKHALLEPRVAPAPAPPWGVHVSGVDARGMPVEDVHSLFRMMEDLMRGVRKAASDPDEPAHVQRPAWVSESEWRSRVEATYQDLRRRTHHVPEPTLRRAAESTVYHECVGERERHQGRTKR